MAVVRLADGSGGEHRYLNVEHLQRFEVSGTQVNLYISSGLMTESFGSLAAANTFADNLAETIGQATVD